MAVVMRVDDEIRLNVLKALFGKRGVMPNIREMQKLTGYHKATIKSSLEFLKKEGLLGGFGPKIDFRKFGYKLEVMVMLQVDTSEKKLFKQFLDKVQKDQHLYRLSSIIGSGNWNMMASYIYPDVESYHGDSMKNYYESIPGIFTLIKDKQIFYATEPLHKNASRTKSVLEIVRKNKGID